jgi:hypothetical protein
MSIHFLPVLKRITRALKPKECGQSIFLTGTLPGFQQSIIPTIENIDKIYDISQGHHHQEAHLDSHSER